MVWGAWLMPVTAGVPIDRARIELCEKRPPRWVMKPRTCPSSRLAVTDGNSSSATTTDPSGMRSFSPPTASSRASSTRRPTSRMSAARSRR